MLLLAALAVYAYRRALSLHDEEEDRLIRETLLRLVESLSQRDEILALEALLKPAQNPRLYSISPLPPHVESDGGGEDASADGPHVPPR